MEEGQKLSLEERLIEGVSRTLSQVKDAVAALSADAGEYAGVMADSYGGFANVFGKISEGLRTTDSLLQNLFSLYSNKGAADAGIKTAERALIHDIYNSLGPLVGFSELLLTDKAYEGLLGNRYGTFKEHLAKIFSGAWGIVAQLGSLSGFYGAKEQKVEPVEASELSGVATTYFIVHIDDEEQSRDAVHAALKFSSNVIPPEEGVFGHRGRRVQYVVASYKGVEEVLAILDVGKTDPAGLDLLITDREMPEQDGYALLNALGDPKTPKQRRPEYANIRNIAMLTGGITAEEAAAISNTYGIKVLTKPFQPLQLEQAIYEIIAASK